MGRQYQTVSFLSDLGQADELVGVIEAVIRDLAPHAHVVHLAHGVRPFDVRGGSLALARAVPYVPEGVVLATVDPGVGTARRALAIEVAGGAGVLVGPDNGLLAPAVAVVGGAERAVELVDPAFHLDAPGATFAGRDVFAPVVAHLCNGVDLGEFGPGVDPAALMPGLVPLPRAESDGVHAEVLWVDRFGNAQLNVTVEDLPVDADVLAATTGGERRAVYRVATFDDLDAGQLGLVVDSHGLLTVVAARRSAAEELRIDVGDAVVLADGADAPGAPGSAVSTPVVLGPTTPSERR
ncbi:MAG: S-adenosyl-l-methionine hydroxide adenosyltransferase family protein [Desertimonas sp.]